VVPTVSFRLLYGILILQHARRELLWLGVTAHPSAEWIAQQLVESFGWREIPHSGLRPDCKRRTLSHFSLAIRSQSVRHLDERRARAHEAARAYHAYRCSHWGLADDAAVLPRLSRSDQVTDDDQSCAASFVRNSSIAWRYHLVGRVLTKSRMVTATRSMSCRNSTEHEGERARR
jgi:hypothetical protein